MPTSERQLTTALHGHHITNINCWSADSQWIVYDTRSTPDGSIFDGSRIERIHAETGEVQLLYESRNGANCGVPTFSQADDTVAFILGPEYPTPEWTYAFSRRQGVLVDAKYPGVAINLDARDIVPPFTPGALRGGSHVHVFSPDGQWVSFTYEDHVLEQIGRNQRNIAVSVRGHAVRVPKSHPRNHDGESFSAVVSKTVIHPRPGSDEICKAVEEGWVGVDGYFRPDGSRQKRALAMQGHVVTEAGRTISEVFILDLPEDITTAGDDPLEGDTDRMPSPPRGVVQRRLTYTATRKFPGLQGPRHWMRASPDGSQIAFLMRDEDGIVQLWTLSPNGGEPVQLTRNRHDIASQFSWSPDGQCVTYVMDQSVFVTNLAGESRRLTERSPTEAAARPEACVFSPDGTRIAFIRTVSAGAERFNQVFLVSL